MSPALRVLLRILGIGALVAGGLVVAVVALAAMILLGPLVFWLAWNVLNFGPAVGLPELGFWGIVLATLFLVVGWFPKVVITGVVFLIDPSWFHGSAQVPLARPDASKLRRRRAAGRARLTSARARTKAPRQTLTARSPRRACSINDACAYRSR